MFEVNCDSRSNDDKPVGLGDGERGNCDRDSEGHHGVGGGQPMLLIPAQIQSHHGKRGWPRPAEDRLYCLFKYAHLMAAEPVII